MFAAAGAAAACEGLEAGTPVGAAMDAAVMDEAECQWPAAVGPADGALDTATGGAGDARVTAEDMGAECKLDSAADAMAGGA
jgi:hypothetical protein